MAPVGHTGMHNPQPSQRSTAMAGFSRLQSTSKVMQYFMHFAQHTFSGSKIASRGHAEMHSRQSVHWSASMTGYVEGADLLMADDREMQ
jgi:hypothetical protein